MILVRIFRKLAVFPRKMSATLHILRIYLEFLDSVRRCIELPNTAMMQDASDFPKTVNILSS
jgi:hypothetical protein